MKVSYDIEADAKYVSIREGKVVKTERENNWLAVDYDKDGMILGVEVLDASKNFIHIYRVGEEVAGVIVEKQEGPDDIDYSGVNLEEGDKLFDVSRERMKVVA